MDREFNKFQIKVSLYSTNDMDSFKKKKKYI